MGNTKYKGTRKEKRRIGEWIKSAILFLVGIVMITPMLWMVSTSFKYESEVFSMPIEWIPSNINFNNYVLAVTTHPYAQWYINTIMVTAAVVAIVLFFSSLSGYAFAKLPYKGRDILFFLFISTMMIPSQVRIIPQYMLYSKLGLINTLASCVVGWFYCAFAIFLMKQFFMSIPDELLEAARIDGAGEIRIFIQIVIPLAKSQLSALGILAFTWGWNEYFAPLIFISDTNKQVLSVGIATFKSVYATNYAEQMAGATLALVPVVIVYIILQNHFIEGIALSGVKG